MINEINAASAIHYHAKIILIYFQMNSIDMLY